jgi:WD40 repeat protein
MQWTVPEPIRRLLFSPSGLYLATAKSYGDEEGDEILRLWDALRGQEVARLEGVGKVVSLAFFSDQELMAVAWDRAVRRGKKDQCFLWDAATGEVRPVWDKNPRPSAGTALPDGKTLALALDSEIVLLDIPSGAIRHRMHAPWNTGLSYDDFAAGGHLPVAGCREDRDDYAVGALWDTRTGKRLHTYELEVGQIFMDGVAVCAAARRLAFAFRDKLHCLGCSAPSASPTSGSMRSPTTTATGRSAANSGPRHRHAPTRLWKTARSCASS